jgi:hypothetical protein
VLIVGVLIGTLSLSPSAALGNEKNSAFSAAAEQNGQGKIIVTVSLNNGFSVCGFSAELLFDPDKLTFAGAEMPTALEEIGFFLTVKESDGRLSVIFHGCENALLGAIARFEFKPMETADLGELRLNFKVNDAYFWENGRLSALPTFSSDVSVIPADEKRENTIPILDSLAVLNRDGDIYLELSGVFPQNCLAAGFDVVLVELSGPDTQKLSISRVMSPIAYEKKESFSIDIPDGGKICLIITPIAYRARIADAGSETVILIDDGVIRD